MAITNYLTSWDGHSGAEVLEFIKSKLQSNESVANNARNNSIVGITAGFKNAGTENEDKTTIQIVGTKGDGTQVTAEFSTITESAYAQHFNEKYSEVEGAYDCKQIIGKGVDLEIPYDYYIEKDGDKKRGYHADVTFTITNSMGSKVYTTRTYDSSTSSTIRSAYFTIPAEYLGVGTNNITMRAITTIGNSQTNVDEGQYQTYVADLKLDVTIPDFQNLRDADENFQMNFNVKDTNNIAIPSGKTYKVNAYVARIADNNKFGEITVNSITTNFTSIYNATNLPNKTPGPVVTLIYQAVMVDSDGNNITSNTVFINMLNRTGINTEGDGLYTAIKLPDVDIPVQSSNVTLNTIQYETVAFDIYLYAKGTDKNYTINLGQDVKASGIIAANLSTPTKLQYSYIFRTYGSLVFSILPSEFSLTIAVSALETSLTEPANIALDLNASEKIAGAVDDEWTDSLNNTCSFQNFDWVSNGWVSTSDGTALLLNNGANLTINYKVCDSSAYQIENYPFTVSIKYKIKNGFNLSENIISCANSTTGFVVKPTYVELKTGSVISQNISNDDTHEVTFVYYGNADSAGIYKGLQAIYIDGKIQAITSAGAFVPHTNNIVISGDQASVYIYSVKAYRRALSFTEIQSIYCFNQTDSTKIANYVKQNNIFSEDTSVIGNYSQSIDRSKLPDGSPILVLYGSDIDPYSFKTINGYAKNEANKKAIHKLDHIMFYIKGVDSARNFYMEGGGLGAQGTSSMAYPVKNYRIYTNKASKNVSYTEDCSVTHMYQGTSDNPLPWNFDPTSPLFSDQLANYEIAKFEKAFAYSIRSTEYGDSITSAPANRFCLKADYAESSGTHNTGFARFSNDVMKESGAITAQGYTSANEESRLPQQHAVDKNNPDWPYDVRSNIDGFPVYLFFEVPAHEENGVTVPAESYFCGRYNFNNDKSNVHVFGFESVDDYFENPIVAAEGKILQQMAVGIDPNYAQTHCAAADDEFINPIECWEFSSNEGISRLIGSFNMDYNTAFTETTGSADEEVSTIPNGLAWINGTWEARYPDISGADEELPYRDGRSKPYLLYLTYKFLNENNYEKHPNINALNTFAENLHLYFNVNSVVKYFILTHWFGSMDQRIKNSMLSFYCDPYGVSADEAAASPLHYMRAYYIFYDNDTILGLNNSGAIKQPWDFYETDQGLFDGTESKYATQAYTAFPGNGIHGIWTNLQKCYELYRDNRSTASSAYMMGKLVNDAYEKLRAKATDDAIEKYFETDQCNQYPAAVHNIDLELKYLNPNNTSTTVVEVPCNLDMAQGTREFHRKNWISKRTLWLDDLYGVNTENYELRYKTADTNGHDNGTIKFQSDSAFRFWRFYEENGSSKRNTGFLSPSDIGTITVTDSGDGTFSQSDYAIFSGLYGCKSIDFSDFNFDNDRGGMGTCDAGTAGLPFPYLQTFILKKYEDNTYVQANDSYGPFPWITPRMLPNLKQLHFCHVRPQTVGGNFGTYRLRDNEGNECTNLEVLDMRDTPISEVVLPNSSALTSLSLEAPTNVTISNKPNITTINIGTTNLNRLIVDSSSSAVYNWALAAANSIYGTAQIINISFGKGVNNPYVIDTNNNNQLDLLNNLAQVVIANPSNSISIFGHIYTTEDYDTSDISEAFPNLNISSTLVTDGFSFGTVGDLYEDSVYAVMDNNTASNLASLRCLEVRSNMPVVSWAIAVDGNTSNSLNERIKIVKSQSQKCWIHADPYPQNRKVDNVDHSLTIYATLADGTIYNTYEINGTNPTIYYNPINVVNITTDNEYTTDDTTLNFTFGEHTKSHLLTSAYINSNPSSFSISATNNANVAFAFNADGVLTGATVGVVGGNDTTVTVSILGNTNTFNVYYDSNLIANLGDITVTSDKYWIKKLANAASNEHYIDGQTFKKSDAASIQILDSHTYWNIMLGLLATEEVSAAQDFSDLKYFQLGATTDGKFDIPAIAFTNLNTPKGTTAVNWISVSSDTSSHGIIKLGNTVKKLCVSLSFSGNIPDNLQFDMSDTEITKVGAYGNSINAIANYTASVLLTANASSVSSVRLTPLFIYPATITEVGNFDKTVTDLLSASPATLMFNLNNGDTTVGMNSQTAYSIIAPLTGLESSTRVKLGAVASYRSKGSAFVNGWTKILEVDKAFVYYNNVDVTDGIFRLPNVQIIGDQSFYTNIDYQANNDITFNHLYLNGAVQKFGTEAFTRAKFEIHNISNPSANTATFNSVTEIGAKAFYATLVSLNLEFGSSLSKVGAQAFETSSTMVIKINRTAALDEVQVSSFGSGTSNVTILVPAGSDLYTQLTATDMQCKNHVQTF